MTLCFTEPTTKTIALDAHQVLNFLLQNLDAATEFTVIFYIPLHDAPASLSLVLDRLTSNVPVQGTSNGKVSRLILVHGWVPQTMEELGIDFQSREENQVNHLEVWTPWRAPVSPEDGMIFLRRRALDTMLTAKGFGSVTMMHYQRGQGVGRHSTIPVINSSLQQLINSHMVAS